MSPDFDRLLDPFNDQSNHQSNDNRIIFGSYEITSEGVFKLSDDKQKQWICGMLVRAFNIKSTTRQWLDGIFFLDIEGCPKSYMPIRSMLRQSPRKVLAHLLNSGLEVADGMEHEVIDFLRACKPDKTLQLIRQLGWLRNGGGPLLFAMAENRYIAAPGAHSVLVDPANTPGLRVLSQLGTLQEWQVHVARPACSQPLLLFALASSFATLFLRFVEASDSFIIHHYGLTSTGKTALLQVIASCYGCGADPAAGRSYLRRWSTTDNALEILAEEHMDVPLVLDELGATGITNLQAQVYKLAGGEGKATMTAQRTRNVSKTWCTIVMSSGEHSMIDQMTKKRGGNTPKGGIHHRLLEVEVKDIAASEPNPEQFVRELKTACATYFGTAGPAFVQAIVDRFANQSEVASFLKDQIEEVLPELLPDGQIKPEIVRGLRRYSLLSVAGEFAVEVGILPDTTAADVRSAVKQVSRRWLADTVRFETASRVVEQVREFLLRHAARFQPIKAAEAPPIANRYGLVDHSNKLWYFTDDALEKAVPGMTADQIAQELKRNELLNSDKDGRMKKKVTIRKGERPRLYAVIGTIFDHGDGEPEPEAEAEAQGSTQTANVSWLSYAA